MDILRFPQGLVGFDGRHEYVLEQWGGADSPFSLLRCVDDPELAFVVVPPGLFFPDYEPELDDEAVAGLELGSAEDALLLVIVTVPDKAADATANLLGPVVVNTRRRIGMQAVLAPERWPARRRLVAETVTTAA
jgi:flagellar assembly factor FliW